MISSQPWTMLERNPFTLSDRHLSPPEDLGGQPCKTYDGSGDPEDHLKLFQSPAKEKVGNADMEFTCSTQPSPKKNPRVWYKAEVLDVEGAPKCMRISGFMHGITHPGLIKRLYERIPRSMDEMYRMTTSFLQGEVAAFSHNQRKVSSSWKPSEGGNKPNFKKGFKNKQRPDRKPDRFLLLTKTPKEIFTLKKGKFKAPPPMITPVEKKDPNKYCEFKSDTGYSTNECMQLRKQIDEMIKAGKLIAKPRITQSFSPETTKSFPPLKEEDGTEGQMIIEVEMGGNFVHRVYIDGGASSEVLYEHCFIKLCKEIRDQMVPTTTHLIGFSGETIFATGPDSLASKNRQ
ncbi:hypothetical protein Tco_0031967 [Tanacetum coccineum]